MKRMEFTIDLDDVHLEARLDRPESAKGLVVFAHGSGSSRLSPRNLAVAQVLNVAGLGTLLFDLMTMDEAKDRALTFDIDFLSERLVQVIDWLQDQPDLRELPIGLFGASTGAAAALTAAYERPEQVRAVVSRGGRPDLALHLLDQIRIPTLLIVGGHDFQVVDFNRKAFHKLQGAKDLAIVPKATHLFEEPGALEEVADLARDWFVRFLPRYFLRCEGPREEQPRT
ncbi:MAG: dienelactone hydrolase family protein [Bdellovibrionaceae bacterium]|nr:dienelactone hydrolase family protein [Pseudobdellovibrionaceae bacterium]